MSLNNVPVERCDIQEIDINIDLPEVVGHQVNSPDDIQDLLVNVDDDDVAKFVVNWLNEEASSGEFVGAVRHIMYASTMLNIASELITAAEQELEDNMNNENPLSVVEMVAEELAKRGHTPEMQQILAKEPELAEALKHQLFGGVDAAAKNLSVVKDALEEVIPMHQGTMDNASLPLQNRVEAGKRIGKIYDALGAINDYLGKHETQTTEEAA